MKVWAEKFYGGKPWRDCRRAFIASKNYLCERCSTNRNPIPAKIAHHRKYLTPENINDASISLSWDNLEALCQDCHNVEHGGSVERDRYLFDDEGNVIPI
ncbi:MAG: HNH endonuclease [Defluviitaleaceae bacterium]|nr:HNH endonuclease [Defluviitaleaceae bacterium]